jgi:hypothetical protein
MDQDIKKLMWVVFQNDPAGIKILEHLSSRFYDAPVYTKGDPHDTIYRLGQRDVIKYIINMLITAPTEENENE